jgi:hypothetical protein|tara:strand:+ start:18534 stop:19148 length:615 start_codon:yes stop_codon:yes gene_type:complete
MKTIVIIIVLVGLGVSVKAQSNLTIEASQNITNFMFENSFGEKVDGYSPSYSGGYALGYSYNLENGLYFPFKAGMRKAGATYIYDNSNYSWSLQYLDLRLGLGYDYSFGKFGTHLSVTGYYGYMLKGIQTLNNQDFDIRNAGDINKNDFGIFFSPGVSFTANDYISVYLDVNYMLGLGNLESNTEQKSNNRMYGATLGLAFSIK